MPEIQTCPSLQTLAIRFLLLEKKGIFHVRNEIQYQKQFKLFSSKRGMFIPMPTQSAIPNLILPSIQIVTQKFKKQNQS